MSKTVEDYSNIVKILKLKLMMLRQENQRLQKDIGDRPTDSETSHKSLIKTLEKKDGLLPHYKAILLNFYDRCQAIGLSPEIVYRIMDKKLAGRVSSQDFLEVILRVKLGLTKEIAAELLTIFDVRREKAVYKEDFLGILNAFNLGSEEYLIDGTTPYQKHILKKVVQGSEDKFVQGMFDEYGTDVTYEDFARFLKKQKSKLSQAEMIALYVALDGQDKFILKRDSLGIMRQRIENLQIVREEERPREITVQPDKQLPKPKRPNILEEPRRVNGRKESKKQTRDEEDDLQQEADTGVEAGNEKKKPATKIESQLENLRKTLNKNKLSLESLISKLLDKASKYISIFDFYRVVDEINKGITRVEVQAIFRQMDIQKKGSLSIHQLILLWFRGQDVRQLTLTFFKMVKVMFDLAKITQIEQYFKSMGAKINQSMAKQVLKKVFKRFQLHESEHNLLFELTNKMTYAKFIQKIIGTQENTKRGDRFVPMVRDKSDVYDNILKKLKPNIGQDEYAEKLKRGEKVTYWKTIFSNIWACWKFCYETAKSLKEPWRDPEFGPSKQDPHGYKSIVSNMSNIPDSFIAEEEVEWVTTSELAKRAGQAPPSFVQGQYSSSDPRQGKIGNCWLISNMSIIAQYPKLCQGVSLEDLLISKNFTDDVLSGVHPAVFKDFKQYGLYVFRFYKAGKPYFVVVDELVPCQQGSSSPVFVSGLTGATWVVYLEKACAKLHHAYSSLIAGDIAEGLSDLTNCIPVKMELQNSGQDLFKRIGLFRKTEQLLGCSIKNKNKKDVKEEPVKLDNRTCGLFYGHAYSINDVAQINNLSKEAFDRDKNRLLKVRNPWGQGEWKLDWADEPEDPDPEANYLKIHMDQIKKLYETRRKNRQAYEDYEAKMDGMFFMAFQDWSKVYTNLFVGLSLPPSFFGMQVQDSWSPTYPSAPVSFKATKQEKEACAKNSVQYVLTLDMECEVLLLLTQPDGRMYHGEKYPYKTVIDAATLLVFKIKPEDICLKTFEKDALVQKNVKLEPKRDITFWRRLQKGKYAILPMTTAFKSKQSNQGEEEADAGGDKQHNFTFTIYSDADPKSMKITRHLEPRTFSNITVGGAKPEAENTAVVRELVRKIQQIGL